MAEGKSTGVDPLLAFNKAASRVIDRFNSTFSAQHISTPLTFTGKAPKSLDPWDGMAITANSNYRIAVYKNHVDGSKTAVLLASREYSDLRGAEVATGQARQDRVLRPTKLGMANLRVVAAFPFTDDGEDRYHSVIPLLTEAYRKDRIELSHMSRHSLALYGARIGKNDQDMDPSNQYDPHTSTEIFTTGAFENGSHGPLAYVHDKGRVGSDDNQKWSYKTRFYASTTRKDGRYAPPTLAHGYLSRVSKSLGESHGRERSLTHLMRHWRNAALRLRAGHSIYEDETFAMRGKKFLADAVNHIRQHGPETLIVATAAVVVFGSVTSLLIGSKLVLGAGAIGAVTYILLHALNEHGSHLSLHGYREWQENQERKRKAQDLSNYGFKENAKDFFIADEHELGQFDRIDQERFRPEDFYYLDASQSALVRPGDRKLTSFDPDSAEEKRILFKHQTGDLSLCLFPSKKMRLDVFLDGTVRLIYKEGDDFRSPAKMFWISSGHALLDKHDSYQFPGIHRVLGNGAIMRAEYDPRNTNGVAGLTNRLLNRFLSASQGNFFNFFKGKRKVGLDEMMEEVKTLLRESQPDLFEPGKECVLNGSLQSIEQAFRNHGRNLNPHLMMGGYPMELPYIDAIWDGSRELAR